MSIYSGECVGKAKPQAVDELEARDRDPPLQAGEIGQGASVSGDVHSFPLD
jgi:hypothetical protein